ncbi:3857_t:CDS:10 [Entrophospora sp. SA101]|nr:3857_t:CDS:10 [Entrophospora sp. SA101]
MPPSAHRFSNKPLSKRAQRQLATKPNYCEGNSSEEEIVEEYDNMMQNTFHIGVETENGRESSKKFKEKEENARISIDDKEIENFEEFHEPATHDNSNKKGRRGEILDKLKKLNNEFYFKKEEIYKENLDQIDLDIKAMREGIHPEYEEQLQQLIEKREQMLEKARLYRSYRLECVEKMFEAEIKQVEKDYTTEKQGLKEQMLADIDERKKKIKEEYEGFDVTSDSVIESSTRYHPQRKLRTRVKEETEVKVKKTKLSRPTVSVKLHESEINDDLAEIGKLLKTHLLKHNLLEITFIKSFNGSTISDRFLTLWDYLKDELTASDFDTLQELKRERVTNFLAIPFAIEKKCDLLKGLLIILVCIALQGIDSAQMYHSIRGQSVIKLYVIFNALEILDRLCCSFGGDILESLFSKSTLAITLNVAINSYSNALLTLLLSNQFIEIKGSVFKRFEKENLFQLSCADIVERFQLALFLSVITIRNLIELSGSPPSPFSILPSSFIPLFPKMTTLETLLTPVFFVFASEICVDWLKHAFITKFNHIRPSVYETFIDVLSKDLVVGNPTRLPPGGVNDLDKSTFVDQSPMVSRRIGFAAIPLACLTIRVSIQTVTMIFDLILEIEEDSQSSRNPMANVASLPSLEKLIANFCFASMIFIKLLVGINLLCFASKRYSKMEKRNLEDLANAQKLEEINNLEQDQVASRSSPVGL